MATNIRSDLLREYLLIFWYFTPVRASARRCNIGIQGRRKTTFILHQENTPNQTDAKAKSIETKDGIVSASGKHQYHKSMRKTRTEATIPGKSPSAAFDVPSNNITLEEQSERRGADFVGDADHFDLRSEWVRTSSTPLPLTKFPNPPRTCDPKRQLSNASTEFSPRNMARMLHVEGQQPKTVFNLKHPERGDSKGNG
ncbi:hypothetical protein LZ554_002631 [Drepanopeziza brunnea f. sp. 'monogermtubi']|nr:hypothetical protein LZ554_002631 [Drepanopeziza brunnea f. sp. 'monogermtubi']